MNATKNTVHVTAGSFKTEVLDSTVPVLVDFWASWCGPCLAVAPILDQLADKYSGKFKIAKVNVDEESQLASQFRVMSIPTLVLVKNGKAVKQMVGLRSVRELEDMITSAL